jgi:UDP-N-acetylmuramoyl-tripeptide--D-alanyl-D-alanine ligase
VTVAAPDYAPGVTEDSETSVHICENREEAIKLLIHLNRGDVVLCKGSRSEKLEEIAQEIEKYWLKKLSEEEEGK